jgi:hypothetical protein
MKSSTFTLAALAVMLAFGTAAYAKGPMGGQADGAGGGMQARTGNPGVGTATGIQTQERTQVQAEEQIRARLQTMRVDGVPGTGAGAAAGTGTPRGIHTPGTGLITTTTTDGTVAVVQ